MRHFVPIIMALSDRWLFWLLLINVIKVFFEIWRTTNVKGLPRESLIFWEKIIICSRESWIYSLTMNNHFWFFRWNVFLKCIFFLHFLGPNIIEDNIVVVENQCALFDNFYKHTPKAISTFLPAEHDVIVCNPFKNGSSKMERQAPLSRRQFVASGSRRQLETAKRHERHET